MGIFSVSQALTQRQGLKPGEIGCRWIIHPTQLWSGLHPSGDRSVVSRRMREGFHGKLTAHCIRECSPRSIQSSQKAVVLIRSGQHCDVRMVLGGGSDHCWTANIDVLDCGLPAHRRISNRFPKRIEIHHHNIDRWDVVGNQIGFMAGIATSGQDAAVNSWMQCLDTTPKDFRRSGVICHRSDGKTSFLKDLGRSTAGEQLIAVAVMQSLSERHQSALVGHAQQRSGSHGSRTGRRPWANLRSSRSTS